MLLKLNINQKLKEYNNLKILNKKVKKNKQSPKSNIGYWIFSLPSKELFWSKEVKNIHGLKTNDIITFENAISFYTDESKKIIKETIKKTIKDGNPWDLILELIKGDGTKIFVRTNGYIESLENGEKKLFGTMQDITDNVENKKSLIEQKNILEVTLKTIDDGIVSFDHEGKIFLINQSMEKILNKTNKFLKGKNINDEFFIYKEKLNEEPKKININKILKNINDNEDKKTSYFIWSGSEKLYVKFKIKPITEEKSNHLIGYLLIIKNVNEEKKLNHKISFISNHDELTGIYNRAYFEQSLIKSFEDYKSNKTKKYALIYIDLDQFKIINDTCGHQVGDLLLQTIANNIGSEFNNGEVFCRMGGDEFAILLEGISQDKALNVANHICQKMETFRFYHDNQQFRIGASIGLVVFKDTMKNVQEIIQAADSACYLAKEAGRNRVHLWDLKDNYVLARQASLKWATKIESAIDEDRFILYVQKIKPILDNKKLKKHNEFLLRMKDVDGTIVMPGYFIPPAERYHLIQRLDRMVIRKAFQFLDNYKDKLEELGVFSINISAQSVCDKNFEMFIMQMIKNAKFDLSNLCFEITETSSITHFNEASLLIDNLRKYKIKIALDDFGTGASFFGYLKQMKVDYIKIDGQFIKELGEDELDLVAVKCFQEVSQVMKIKTVAEFVENDLILNQLKEIGVDYAQGYAIHRPEPLINFIHREIRH